MQKKGIKYYFQGKKVAGKAFRKNFSLYFKYWIFIVANMFAKISIIFFPFGEKARYQLVESVELKNDFKVSDIVEDLTDDNKSEYFSLFKVHLVKTLIIVSGVYIMSKISKLVWFLALELDNLWYLDFEYEELKLLPVIFMIPMLLITVVFTIIVLIKYDTTVFIANTKKKSAKEALVLTNKIYNKKTFGKMFSIYFLNVLEFLITIALFYAATLLTEYLFGEHVKIAFQIVFVIILLFKFAKTVMSMNISRYHVLKDIIKDFEINHETSEEALSSREQLIKLFDENSEAI